jgi:UDP-N-acetylglucosamine--N-acetylmuramyl-(pentapeptide) pyrophosphoryl-undecaprenol N-acetylglucosamine transferase
MRVLFVSGGSIGHLAPLIAVEQELRSMKKNAQTHFLCTTKDEDAAFLKKEGATFTQAPIPKKGFSFPLQYYKNRSIAAKLLTEFQPDVIFSKGGAVSIPLCLLAKKRGIPIVIHESDSVMGKANRMIAKFATAICLGFPPSDEQRALPVSPIVTGNPVRASVTKGKKKAGRDLAHLTGKNPVLLVLGGSQGATALNDAIVLHQKELLGFCDIVHLTGIGKKGAPRHAGYYTREIAYNELPDLYAIADLALIRAGAGSISECAANNIPMILVPIRGLANDHQYENAVRASAKGAAILLEQEQLNRDLPAVVQTLLHPENSQLSLMKKATQVLQHPEAARRIAEIILQCIASGRRNV